MIIKIFVCLQDHFARKRLEIPVDSLISQDNSLEVRWRSIAPLNKGGRKCSFTRSSRNFRKCTFETISPRSFALSGNSDNLMLCFSNRMKQTAFLLVFGVALSFCLAQVSPALKSDKSLRATHDLNSGGLCIFFYAGQYIRRKRRRWQRRRNTWSFSPPL